MTTKRSLLIFIFVLFSGSVFAGNGDAFYKVTVPKRAQILDVENGKNIVVMPYGCYGDACYFWEHHHHFNETFTVTIGKNKWNKCKITIDPDYYWFSYSPIFTTAPQCVGRYSVKDDIYKVGLHQYGFVVSDSR